MNRKIILLAATMSVGSFTFAPVLFGADPVAANSNAQQQDNPQQMSDVHATRSLIGKSAEAAVRENGFGDVAGNFSVSNLPGSDNSNLVTTPAPGGNQGQQPGKGTVNPDARATDIATSSQTDKLNEQIRAFRTTFKTKYGQDFAVKDAQMLYSDIVSANLQDGQAQPAAAVIKADNNAPAPAADAGANSANSAMQSSQWATLTLPAYQDAPAVTVHLVREGNDFKFAAMRHVNQQTLVMALTDCVTKLNGDPAHWPDDANTAERLVSQHVLGAVQKAQESDMDIANTPAGSTK